MPTKQQKGTVWTRMSVGVGGVQSLVFSVTVVKLAVLHSK